MQNMELKHFLRELHVNPGIYTPREMNLGKLSYIISVLDFIEGDKLQETAVFTALKLEFW